MWKKGEKTNGMAFIKFVELFARWIGFVFGNLICIAFMNISSHLFAHSSLLQFTSSSRNINKFKAPFPGWAHQIFNSRRLLSHTHHRNIRNYFIYSLLKLSLFAIWSPLLPSPSSHYIQWIRFRFVWLSTFPGI